MCIITLSAFIKHVLSLHCDVQIEKIKTAILNSLFHRLNCCYMSPLLCATVASVLRSLIRPTLKLLTLDLSYNDLGDLGLESLAFALHERCTLQGLRYVQQYVHIKGLP